MRPGQRSGLLGVIITNIDNPYYTQVLLGIEHAAKLAGRLIITGISHNDPKVEAQLVKDLVARQIEGLIVVPASADAPHLIRAIRQGIPLVLASRGIRHPGVDTVLVDDIRGVREAVGDLIARGFTPVSFVGGSDAITTAARRFQGFSAAHADHRMPIRPDLVVRMSPTPADVVDATRNLLDLDDPPKAFFTSNNRYTVSVLRVLIEQRNRWPEADRPRLVGFDGIELADVVPYPLRLIEHDAHALGVIAAEMVLKRIEDGTLPPVTITLPSVGVVRGAVAAE